MTSGGNERWRLVLSDGKHFAQSMLATQQNEMISSGELMEMSIVTLTDYIVNIVHNKRWAQLGFGSAACWERCRGSKVTCLHFPEEEPISREGEGRPRVNVDTDVAVEASVRAEEIEDTRMRCAAFPACCTCVRTVVSWRQVCTRAVEVRDRLTMLSSVSATFVSYRTIAGLHGVTPHFYKTSRSNRSVPLDLVAHHFALFSPLPVTPHHVPNLWCDAAG